MMIDGKQKMLRAMRAVPIAFAFAVGAGLAACKSKPPKPPPPPPPVVLTLSLTASADVNPDAQNRSSPIVVRIYQLKDDAAFKDADIYSLFDKEQSTLGAGLTAREEFELSPLEHRTLTVKPPPEVRFIGVVASYRDIVMLSGAPRSACRIRVKRSPSCGTHQRQHVDVLTHVLLQQDPWSEGLFLQPQHFQQQTRFFEQLLETRV